MEKCTETFLIKICCHPPGRWRWNQSGCFSRTMIPNRIWRQFVCKNGPKSHPSNAPTSFSIEEQVKYFFLNSFMHIYALISLHVWIGLVVTDIWLEFHVSRTFRNIFTYKLGVQCLFYLLYKCKLFQDLFFGSSSTVVCTASMTAD